MSLWRSSIGLKHTTLDQSHRKQAFWYLHTIWSAPGVSMTERGSLHSKQILLTGEPLFRLSSGDDGWVTRLWACSSIRLASAIGRGRRRRRRRRYYCSRIEYVFHEHRPGDITWSCHNVTLQYIHIYLSAISQYSLFHHRPDQTRPDKAEDDIVHNISYISMHNIASSWPMFHHISQSKQTRNGSFPPSLFPTNQRSDECRWELSWCRWGQHAESLNISLKTILLLLHLHKGV